MNSIDLFVHTQPGDNPQPRTLAIETTIAELLQQFHVEDAEETILVLEEDDAPLEHHRRLSELGIHHGQHLHRRPRHFQLIVNGRHRTYDRRRIPYLEVVRLAFDPIDPETIYTVTYKKGPPQNPEGRMVQSDVVFVKSGMIFNVTATRKS